MLYLDDVLVSGILVVDVLAFVTRNATAKVTQVEGLLSL